jgi:hypothetical protein
LHNWLLEVDGLHENWEEGAAVNGKAMKLGSLKWIDSEAIPQHIRNRLSTTEFQAYDSSRFGRFDDNSIQRNTAAGDVMEDDDQVVETTTATSHCW